MAGHSHTPEGAGEPTITSPGGMNKGYTTHVKASRGTELVEQYPRDNTDWPGLDESEARVGRSMGGGCGDISHSIKNGSVPFE